MASINDVVLIHFEDQPLSFARIEEILPDAKRGWFHVKLLLLQVPLQTVTWILREAYIDGEAFTMGGNRIRLAPVICPDADEPAEPLKIPPVQSTGQASLKGKAPGGKIISLAAAKKKP
jgi:hypothetical protein